MKKINWINMLLITVIWAGGFMAGCGGGSSLLKPTLEVVATKANEDVNIGLTNKIEEQNLKIEKLAEITSNLESQIDANIQAGVGNSQEKNEIQAQGNVTQVTNDTGLIKYIMYILGSLCMALIAGLIAIAKKLISTLKEKKDYKDNFMAKCINNEEELRIFREKHKLIK